MPFPMVHLFVAHALTITNKIDDLSQFYLGILAPDSYYHRKEYSFEDRKISHLASDDSEIWQNDAVRFIEEHRNDNEKWFYTGYGVHILTDILWDNMIYKPFLLSYSQDEEASHSNPRDSYRKDMTMIDLLLYRSCDFKDELWTYISDGKSVDVHGLVSAIEIETEKNSTLMWYDSKKDYVTDDFRYITPERVYEFINQATRDIDDILSYII